MTKLRAILAALCLLTVWAPSGSSASFDGRPNILIIMADDLGYTDLGAYGGEIRTPNLDALALRGLRLTSFHTGATCSPSRAMLMAGTDHHLAGLGSMAEATSPRQSGAPGYEGYLNLRVVALSELLQDAGYRTYMTGKWHLGTAAAHSPAARGFDRSFALLPGGAGHFDATGLIEAGHPAVFRENGELVDLPRDFGYASNFYTRRLISYIEDGATYGKPFFAFLSFTAPHWPLQAPPEYIMKYAGRYDAGHEEIRNARLGRAADLGVIDARGTPPNFAPPAPDWASLSEQARKAEARRMEIYAAMVDNLDANVGRLLDFLRDRKLLDNTVVLFLSDNGPEAADFARSLPQIANWANTFDNSYANMGTATSYIWQGPHWGQVSAQPGRLYKSFQTQGGIRVPAFITYEGFVRQGKVSDVFLTVKDVMPTLLDIAGVEHPGRQYKGRNILPMQGRSMLPWLMGKVEQVHGEDHVTGWELFGKRALRRGDWKIVWHPAPFGSNDWELFNLAEDPSETRDLSRQYPKKRAELMAYWDDYVLENGVILPEQAIGY